jgi:hypothetical protein
MSLLLIIKIHALIKIDSKRDNSVTPMIMMFLQQHSAFLLVEGYLYPMLFIILWFGNFTTGAIYGTDDVKTYETSDSCYTNVLTPPVFSEGSCYSIFSFMWCRSLSFCPFSLGHCVVCPSTTYGFWLPLWYLQTFLN